MIILSCNEISKSFGIDVILENISFSINAGEKIGLVGANGTGKTTLFKVLTGQYGFDSGEMYLSKELKIGYMEQNTELHSEHTVFDETLEVFENLILMESELRNLEHQISEESTKSDSHQLQKLMDIYSHKSEEFQNLNGYGYRSEIRGVLKGLGFSEAEFEQPVIQLSGGQKTRISLAKLLLKKPDILLLDEPTNHLDMEAIEWLESFLKTYEGTVLIISHDRYFLDQIVQKVFEIENKQLFQYNGTYSDYVNKKKILYEQRLKEYNQQQKDVERQEEIIRRFKQHGTEKLAKRAKSREKRLEHLNLVEKPTYNENRAKISFEPQIKSGDDVLAVENLSKNFDQNTLFENIEFKIYKGERVALIGPNGIGKSTLLKIILGIIPNYLGDVKLGHNVHMGYFDQEQALLNPNNTIIDEIWEENIRFTQTEVRSLLGSFLFTGEDVFKLISNLSGGEKGRVSLLKLMLSKANFLLMDEPTNHLDIASKEVLEEALVNYKGTLLIISHDRYFLNKVANKIISLSQDGIKEYLGNYDYYYEKKNALLDEINENSQPLKTKTQLREEKRKEKEKLDITRKNKLYQQDLEKKINLLETDLNELHQLMCQEEVYSNPDKSMEIHEKVGILKKDLDKMYEEWEEILE